MIKKTDRDLWLPMVGGRVLKTAITALLVFMISGSVSAAVRLPKIFSDNMILQQEMPVPVWGWADKGEKVTVSFTPPTGSGQAYQEKTSVAGNDGRWKVTLDPVRSSKMPAELKIVGTNVITVRNILVGEVWICSGQSNMVLTLKQVAAFDDAVVADHPFIRHFGVPNKADQLRKDDLDGGAWTVCTPKAVLEFTAVGFFFGRELAKHLNVPVGLINSSWGGTPIEAWTAPEGLRQVPEIAGVLTQVEEWDPSTPVGGIKHAEFIAKVKEWVPKAEEALAVKSALPPIPVAPNTNINQYSPTTLFNCMINPLIPFAIRGVIWYQGEANGYEGMSYLYKMKGLVGGWRQLWKQGDFPFYFVQLANFQSGDPRNVWQKLRQAQLQAMYAIPRTGMAVTIDIGEGGNIHPKNKQDVGLRLARWALAKDYKKECVFSGPLYKKHVVEGSRIRIFFDYVWGGLMVGEKKDLEPTKEVMDGKLKCFYIAGEDQVWQQAEAVIEDGTVLVSSGKVAKPVAIRYAFAMNPVGPNLYNKDGLPASPFCTDNW